MAAHQETYGRSTVEKVVTAEQVPDMLELFARIADGESGKMLVSQVIQQNRARYQKFLRRSSNLTS